MSEQLYRQVKLVGSRGGSTLELVCWLPEQLAKPDAIVTLQDDLPAIWQVVEVYSQTRRPLEQIRSEQRTKLPSIS